jgi:hypothetical protein
MSVQKTPQPATAEHAEMLAEAMDETADAILTMGRLLSSQSDLLRVAIAAVTWAATVLAMLMGCMTIGMAAFVVAMLAEPASTVATIMRVVAAASWGLVAMGVAYLIASYRHEMRVLREPLKRARRETKK